jgi:hypothetical protein
MAVVGVTPFERFFRQAADLDVDKADVKRYESFVRDKIADLLTIAQAGQGRRARCHGVARPSLG